MGVQPMSLVGNHRGRNTTLIDISKIRVLTPFLCPGLFVTCFKL